MYNKLLNLRQFCLAGAIFVLYQHTYNIHVGTNYQYMYEALLSWINLTVDGFWKGFEFGVRSFFYKTFDNTSDAG